MNPKTIKYLEIFGFIILLIVTIIMIYLNIKNKYFDLCQSIPQVKESGASCIYNPASKSCIACKYPLKPSWYQFIQNSN